MDLSEVIVPADLTPKPMVTCVVEGHLEAEDLRELALANSVVTDQGVPAVIEEENPADLTRIKEKHHSVARMIAGGLSQRMVSQLCGYTESYLSILLNNPAMKELIEMYRIQNGSAAAVITEKLRTVGLKAVENLETKIDAGDLNANELIQAAKLGLDRSDHGPSSKQHLVREDHIFDHAELQAKKAAAHARNAGRIVSRDEVRKLIAPPTESSSENNGNVGPETSGVYEDRSE